ncbi:glutamate--cysteine ligase, partial [Neisseria gonorrhoeae]|uniref:glutamate--cysteine ligase n=1 Tax=Neisseria gonorrhoeae TaxID=485 RepID=UPI00384E01BD
KILLEPLLRTRDRVHLADGFSPCVVLLNNDLSAGIPDILKGIQDPISKLQVDTLDQNIKEFGALAYFPFMDKGQGIVHVMG